jgi:hypothetical protein
MPLKHVVAALTITVGAVTRGCASARALFAAMTC